MTPDTLVYPRRRTGGRFVVRTPDGATAATVTVTRAPRRRFEIFGADGELLARGRRTGFADRRWSVTDPSRTEVLSVRETGRRRRREVTPSDGYPHGVERSRWSLGWRLVDGQGRGRLLVQPRRRIWPLRPEYLVHTLDPRLTLVDVLALVEINWQIAARDRTDLAELVPDF